MYAFPYANLLHRTHLVKYHASSAMVGLLSIRIWGSLQLTEDRSLAFLWYTQPETTTSYRTRTSSAFRGRKRRRMPSTHPICKILWNIT